MKLTIHGIYQVQSLASSLHLEMSIAKQLPMALIVVSQRLGDTVFVVSKIVLLYLVLLVVESSCKSFVVKHLREMMSVCGNNCEFDYHLIDAAYLNKSCYECSLYVAILPVSTSPFVSISPARHNLIGPQFLLDRCL